MTDPALEHSLLVAESRLRGGYAGNVLAGYAGAIAARAGLRESCPYGADEAERSAHWHRCCALGMDADIPSPRLRLPPQGARTWTPIPGSTHAAHAAQAED